MSLAIVTFLEHMYVVRFECFNAIAMKTFVESTQMCVLSKVEAARLWHLSVGEDN